MAAIGIRMCFKANGGSAGLFFFERLNAVGFVLLVRFSAFVLMTTVTVFFTKVRDFVFPTDWEYICLVMLGVSVLYWFRLASHMRSFGKAVGAGVS